MSGIDRTKPVLVTGSAGYVASWIVKLLLEEGRVVRATVRNTSDNQKTGHLQEIAEKSKGTLELLEADLMKEGSFDEAMKDCELVIHTASPFFLFGIKDAQKELVDPAVNGTKNVLTSANRISSVKRVVLTSSVAAIFGDALDINSSPNGVFTEADWNFSSSIDHQPYAYSKFLAEKEAWAIAGKQDRWDLLTINPGFMMGPSLSKRVDSTSMNYMISTLNGTFKQGVPDFYFPFVDVRDVAQAHLLAGSNEKASGRHILVADSMSTLDFADILREKYPDFLIPKKKLPNFMLYLTGPLQGLKWKFLKQNLGVEIKIDNSYSKKDLNIQYTPLKKTFHDHAEQLVKNGLI